MSIFRSARACGDQALARTPPGVRHTTPMISRYLVGSLGLSCLRGASLEETLGEDSPLATSMPATPATEVQPEDHRNALDSNVLQKTPAAGYGASANVPQVQSCVRTLDSWTGSRSTEQCETGRRPRCRNHFLAEVGDSSGLRRDNSRFNLANLRKAVRLRGI